MEPVRLSLGWPCDGGRNWSMRTSRCYNILGKAGEKLAFHGCTDSITARLSVCACPDLNYGKPHSQSVRKKGQGQRDLGWVEHEETVQ